MTEPLVATTGGRVRGLERDGIFQFKGIPFAAAPVGTRRRFCPPVAPEPWDGVRDCRDYGPGCPQQSSPFAAGGVLGYLGPANGPANGTDEDCLNLNVWTPGLDAAQRPTMVWIHGGAFSVGSGSGALADGTTFARDGAVFVSVNYRLHALGFLYLDEDFDGAEGSGNAGILDQLAALRWVRENIAAFGGDPDNVTILGESAGGMSVGTLMGTPGASGLYRHAVAESGAGSSNVDADRARAVTRQFLRSIGVQPGDWDALAAVPVDEVVAAASQRGVSSITGGGGMHFGPVIDGTTRSDQPYNMVARGSAGDADLLVGWNADEMRLFVYALPAELQAMIPDPDLEPLCAAAGRTVDEVLKVYGANRPDADPRSLALSVQTDHAFGIPAHRLAQARRASGGRAFVYRFDWRTPVLDGALGACHGLEQPFAFDWDLPVFTGDDAPAALRRAMHGAWLQFARTGDPNADALPEWPEYDAERRAVMLYSEHSRAVDDPAADERRLWMAD